MDKSTQSFDYLLKDFEPNLNYKEKLVTNDRGIKTLRRYPIEIPGKFKINHPFMVYLIFVKIKNYSFLPHFEKVLWEIPILYKGFPFVLAHRKFGFDITTQTPKNNYQELGIEAIEKIFRAIPHAEPQLSNLIKQKVEEGKITIESRYQEIKNRYIFFQEQILNSNEYEEEKLKGSIKNFSPLNHIEKSSFIDNYRKIQRLQSRNYYYLVAMVDTYFSLIEHISVLLLPFLPHIEIQKINIQNFMNESWKNKLKTILNHPSNLEAVNFLNRLDQIKEQVRNPISHGHFHKKGHSLFVQIEGLGSIPFTLSKSQYKFSNGYPEPTKISGSEIIKTFEDFNSYLEKSHTRFGMEYIKRDLPIAFDEKSSILYREKMKSEESTEKFINETVQELENCLNMDW